MYSQRNEEQVITDYFKGQSGRLLDVGAYDGKTFSNTLRLLELGWSGVLVEPSSFVFRALVENTRSLNVELVNSPVTPVSRVEVFYDSFGDALTTSDVKHKSKWESKGSKFFKFYTKSVTFAELFEVFGFNFDFINIDVEGCSYELFLDLFRFIKDSKLNVRLLCVEHDYKHDDILRMLQPFGFRKLLYNDENIILGK